MISEFDFKKASISIEGDYYQVLFHDDLDAEDEPYFMIQAQFEVPDRGECYFESHREELIGHNRAISASLSKNVFRVSYGQQRTNNVLVRFSEIDDGYDRLVSALTRMIPIISMEIEI
ncbi:hypothetical protein [Leucothrix pacifica]|uniref:Uncharacterized protein n=1 Tax=Leucothrix pacifica TaxID=1247513 RepID=A0A317CJX1_9GAMM|nr:hypothetical protein [Leucothrix pacifica]PWQ96610.1 hypothetical protein DKW60_12565 [Leucothrix pacifica]